MRLPLFLRSFTALAAFAAVPAVSFALPSQWTKLTFPTSIGTSVTSEYVTRDGMYAFFSSGNGVFRALTTEIETYPTAPSYWKSWTKVPTTNFPQNGGGGYQTVKVWTEDPVTHDVLAYAGSASSCGSGNAACRIVRINHFTLAVTRSNTTFNEMLTGIAVDPTSGYVFASSLGPNNIFASSDRGLNFTNIAPEPYSSLASLPAGYIYGFKLIGGTFHWGGEGPDISSDFSLSNNNQDFDTSNYHRDGGWFASDVYESGTPRYVLSCCLSNLTSGFNLQRWDSVSQTWTQLDSSNGLVPWAGEAAGYGDNIAHGVTPDEFYVVFTGSRRSSIVYTKNNGVTKFYPMPTAGLPAFNSYVAPQFIRVNSKSGAVHLLVWNNHVRQYYVRAGM